MPISLGSLTNVDRSAPKKSRAIRITIAISFANLCYLRVWEVLFYREDRDYFAAAPYSADVYIGAVLGTSALAIIIYRIINSLHFGRKRVFRALAMGFLLLMLALPIDFVRRTAYLSWLTSSTLGLVVFAGGGLLIAAFALALRQRFFYALLWVVGLASPYAVFNFGRAVIEIYGRGPRVEEHERLPDPPASEWASVERRVIWVVFDEWDYNALFVHRPAELKLPALDKIVQCSVNATQAYAVANSTRVSIPSLLTGKVVSEAIAQGEDRLLLRFSPDGDWKNFKECDHIVKDALSLGVGVAAYGWYHPYDRIFPDSPLLRARSFGFPAYNGIGSGSLPGSVLAQVKYLTIPRYGKTLSIELYEEMHAAALGAVRDASIGFVYLHYGVPHGPWIFDASSGNFSVGNSGNIHGYYGNLALVDRTLAELLNALSQSRLRGATTLVLTSDHWWRSAPWVAGEEGFPVPLLIDVNGAGPAVVVREPLHTTSLRSVAHGILTGRLRDNVGVAAELKSQAVGGPVRYAKGRLVQ